MRGPSVDHDKLVGEVLHAHFDFTILALLDAGGILLRKGREERPATAVDVLERLGRV